MNFQEAKAQWDAHVAMHEKNGVYLGPVSSYLPDEYRSDFQMAQDAQPVIQTAANAGVPFFLTTWVDPDVFKVLFAPNKAAVIIGEKRKGSWTDTTAMFPTIEHSGEVSSYGDFVENGRAGANSNFPQRQNYLFQTMKEYGELELDRAGTAKINWAAEVDLAAATVLNKFLNLTYVFGVSGLQNYGLSNDPFLPASITPAPKAYGGTKWISGGAIVATANEIYADFESLYLQLVNQTAGLVEQDTKMVLAISPASAVALTATNSFGVSVPDLLKKSFPNLRIETVIQYGALSTSNPQGIAAGNFAQLIAEEVDGQETGYCSFSEKMRMHKVIPYASSYRQKVTGGTWGAILRQPFAIAGMVGL